MRERFFSQNNEWHIVAKFWNSVRFWELFYGTSNIGWKSIFKVMGINIFVLIFISTIYSDLKEDVGTEDAFKTIFVIVGLIVIVEGIYSLLNYIYLNRIKHKIICCEEGFIYLNKRYKWGIITSISINEANRLINISIKDEIWDIVIDLTSLEAEYENPQEIYDTDRKLYITNETKKGINVNDINLAGLNFLYILKRRAYKAKWSSDIDLNDLIPG